MTVQLPPHRVVRWLLPSVVGLVLLFLLPEPFWPLAFLPALSGHLSASRRDDLHRPLKFGFVVACMSPFLIVAAATGLCFLSPSLREHLPSDGIVRLVLFLAWTVSIYTLWRRSLRPRGEAQ